MTKPEDALVERLRPRAGCSNKHCGDSSPCRDCVGCFLDTALDAITTLIERERRKDAALDEAEAYLAAGAGWTNKDLENPIMARACGMGCREGLEKLRKARAALTREGE